MYIKNWRQYSDSLIKAKEIFTVEKTTLGIKFITRWGKNEFWDNEKNEIPKSELGLIKAVKTHCEALPLELNVNRKKIRYIDISPIVPNMVHTDIYEIDLTGAYWNIAFREGIINKELFERGKLVSKKARLIALGALAKNVTTLYFDGERWTIGGITENKKADYFFRVAEMTGEIMQELKYCAGSNYLFYWVDAIFFRAPALNEIKRFLFSRNLEYKIYPIDTLQSDNQIIYVSSEYWRTEKKKVNPVRKFSIKKENFDLGEKPQLKAYNHKTVLSKIK